MTLVTLLGAPGGFGASEPQDGNAADAMDRADHWDEAGNVVDIYGTILFDARGTYVETWPARQAQAAAAALAARGGGAQPRPGKPAANSPGGTPPTAGPAPAGRGIPWYAWALGVLGVGALVIGFVQGSPRR